jgi:hypothetical protein
VQHGLVRLVAHGAQRRGFGRRRIGQHAQRVVGMGGEDHLVEGSGWPPRITSTPPGVRRTASMGAAT